jgi:hypothetical protein
MTMKLEELRAMARSAGAAGIDYQRFLHDDATGEAFESLDEADIFGTHTTANIEDAFVEGRREYRQTKGGWIVCWTTAKADYDQFGTEEIECHEWNGRSLRKVLMEPNNAVFQRGRYLSGAAIWDEDPREVERKIRETIDRENAEAEERRVIREVGLSWLRSADLSQRTDEDLVDNELRSRGLVWKDLWTEQARREEDAKTAERAAEWNRCRSMFADGCTIVDPGRDAQRGQFGVIPGSDCAVYRNVRVVPHWSAKDSVEDARVVDERHTDAGSLWFVAERLQKGEYRIATADECLPPALVLDRLKPSRLHNLLRVETEGRVVWASRERFSYSNIVVVDEQGKLVRKKSIKEAGERAVRAKEDF